MYLFFYPIILYLFRAVPILYIDTLSELSRHAYYRAVLKPNLALPLNQCVSLDNVTMLCLI